MVAVLDPRLATASYGKTLLEAMPPLWLTDDRDVAIAALGRLREAWEGGEAQE
jgi:ATP-dependent DNA helicase DinG